MFERFKGIDDEVGDGDNGRGANKDGLDWEGPKKNSNPQIIVMMMIVKFMIFVIIY